MDEIILPTLEDVRAHVGLLQRALESHDKIVEDINSARWNLELIRRMPELGRTMDRQGRMRVITADEVAQNLKDLEAQRDVMAASFMALAGATDVDHARSIYLDLFARYQRLGGLRQLQAVYVLGVPAAGEEVKKELEGLPPDTTLAHVIEGATIGLTSFAADHPLPPVSAISLVPHSLILPE